MGVVATIERSSFAAGELGKQARARADLAKYQVAVAKMENYITMVEGGATRSPGTRFVLELFEEEEPGKLLPFRLTSTDYYMLVVNGGEVRFVRAGGFLQNDDTTPYQIPVPYSQDDLASLKSASTGNIVYTVDGKRWGKLTRSGLRDWDYADVEPFGGPLDTKNVDQTITIVASAVTGTGINLTGVGSPFKAAMANRVMRLDDRDLSLVPEWAADEEDVAANAQRRWNGNVYENVSGDTAGPNAPSHTDGDLSSGDGFITWRYLHSGYGFVKIKTFVNANAVTADVVTRLPDSVVSGATYRFWPPAWTSDVGFPTGIAFASPRLLLTRDDVAWLTGIDNPEDLNVTGEDDGAITVRLRAPGGELVEIQWATVAGALILGSSDLEWTVRAGASLYEPLTAANINPIPDSDEGSKSQNPARVDGGVIFVGKSGTRLHYGKIDPNATGAQRFVSDEISVTARHIFKAGVKVMAWQRDPHRVLWMVMNDGTLAALTFMPKQEVFAFHRHPRTNAFFEDVAVIPSTSSGVDEVYFIVRRDIAGTTRRYVEQLADFFEPLNEEKPTADGAWFLDCAQSYSGPKIKTITSLAHLEGCEVGVFADGLMQGRKTVSSGTIVLDRMAANILIGIPVRAQLTDLPRNITEQDGPTIGKAKTVHEGVFYFDNTGGGTVSCNDGEEEPIIESGDKKYGSSLPLFSGVKTIPMEAEFAAEAVLNVINDDAMPCTVLAMSPREDIEETP